MGHKAQPVPPDVLDQIPRIQRMLDQQEFAQAHELAEAVAEKARHLGVRSAYLSWLRAMAADYVGKLKAALAHIEEATMLDPLGISYRHSREIVVARIRNALAATDRAPDDPTTPELWSLLARSGQADSASHLVVARFHLATGNSLEAMHVVEAVTTLWPACGDAWALKAVLAARLNDRELATRAAAEAAALGENPSPFTVAPMAQG